MLAFFKRQNKTKTAATKPHYVQLRFPVLTQEISRDCNPHALMDWRLQRPHRQWASFCSAAPRPWGAELSSAPFACPAFFSHENVSTCLCMKLLVNLPRCPKKKTQKSSNGHSCLRHRSVFHTSSLSRGSFYQGSSWLSGPCIPWHRAAPSACKHWFLLSCLFSLNCCSLLVFRDKPLKTYFHFFSISSLFTAAPASN